MARSPRPRAVAADAAKARPKRALKSKAAAAASPRRLPAAGGVATAAVSGVRRPRSASAAAAAAAAASPPRRRAPPRARSPVRVRGGAPRPLRGGDGDGGGCASVVAAAAAAPRALADPIALRDGAYRVESRVTETWKTLPLPTETPRAPRVPMLLVQARLVATDATFDTLLEDDVAATALRARNRRENRYRTEDKLPLDVVGVVGLGVFPTHRHVHLYSFFSFVAELDADMRRRIAAGGVLAAALCAVLQALVRAGVVAPDWEFSLEASGSHSAHADDMSGLVAYYTRALGVVPTHSAAETEGNVPMAATVATVTEHCARPAAST